MKSGSFHFGTTYKCSTCGKEFWVADSSQWIYKNTTPFKMFCSYTCYRKHQKDGKKYKTVK